MPNAETINNHTTEPALVTTGKQPTTATKQYVVKKSATSLNPVETTTGTKDFSDVEEATIESDTFTEPSFIAQLRSDYLEKFPPEKFDITGNETTVITTIAGSMVSINPNDLETIDGKTFDGPIQFYIKEMMTPADMLRMHAPTISNGGMLESGGAWYINATAEGKPLRIKQGKSIVLSVKKTDEDNQPFSVFTSSTQAANTSQPINWEQTDELFLSAVSNSLGSGPPIKGIQLYDEYFTTGKRRVYPAEIWQIHRTYLSKEKKAKTLFNRKADDSYNAKDFYLSDLTEKQNSRLGEILDNAGIVNRITNRSATETRVSFLFEYGSGAGGIRVLVDSVATTELSPWLSKRLKKVIVKKINAFNKEYFKRFNEMGQVNAGTLMATANLNQFGWINCDRFSNYPIKTFYCTNIKGADSVGSLQVYLVFKRIKSLLLFNSKDRKKNIYRFDNIPPRKEVMLVATGFNGKHYFAGKTDYFSLQPRGNTDVQVSQMTKDEMQSFLQKLE